MISKPMFSLASQTLCSKLLLNKLLLGVNIVGGDTRQIESLVKCLQVIGKLYTNAKRILLLFMIFITRSQRSLQGKKQLFHSWSMKPLDL